MVRGINLNENVIFRLFVCLFAVIVVVDFFFFFC
jgi:hypothetical protein